MSQRPNVCLTVSVLGNCNFNVADIIIVLVTSLSNSCIYSAHCCVLSSRLALFHSKGNMIFNQMCFDKSGVLYLHFIFFLIYLKIANFFQFIHYTFLDYYIFTSSGKCRFSLLYLHYN